MLDVAGLPGRYPGQVARQPLLGEGLGMPPKGKTRGAAAGGLARAAPSGECCISQPEVTMIIALPERWAAECRGRVCAHTTC